MAALINLVGRRFGRLVVAEKSQPHISPCGTQSTVWVCRCDCGNEVAVFAQNLMRGRTLSCGCYNNEVRGKQSKTHGETDTRLYGIWCSMKRRCHNPHDTGYFRYGARGITVCDEWRNSYESFRDWAVSHGYGDGLTIDRRDNEKGYGPDNCRWATATEQANNRGKTFFVMHDGKYLPLSEWARLTGIKYGTLYYRLASGWPVDKALTTCARGG